MAFRNILKAIFLILNSNFPLNSVLMFTCANTILQRAP